LSKLLILRSREQISFENVKNHITTLNQISQQKNNSADWAQALKIQHRFN